MKKIIAILTSLVLVIAFTTTAQSIYDRSGSYIGKVDSNGYAYDRSGSYMGKINSDGSVYDRSGSYMGKTQGISRERAALIFFFRL